MQADYVLDYATIEPDKPRTLNLMARFSAGKVSRSPARRPLNLSLVIDRSGSMAGQKLDYTRQAAQFLVQNLTSQDILSIVLYNDKVETLLSPEHVQRKDAINQRIASISAGGTTNLSGGWLEGCQLVSQNYDESRLNRVILMSDGLTNRGVTATEELVSLAQQKHEGGVSTTTMGLGGDFNEDLMMALASAGGGAFYFIESPEVTPAIFQEELRGLLNVVGQNLSVRFEPETGVSIKQQLNAYPAQANDGQTVFRLGDIFADEVKALVLEIDLPAYRPTGDESQKIATLRFEYDELDGGHTERRVVDVAVHVTVESGAAIVPHADVNQSVLLLSAARARREAIIAADKGHYEAAAALLREAAERLASSTVDPRLLEERNALILQADEFARNRYDDYSRKMMSTQSLYTMTNRHDNTVELRNRNAQRQKNMLPQPQINVEKREGVAPTHITWRDQTHELIADVTRIGRSSENEIVLAVRGISRFHCRVKREGDQVMIEDLGSTNGTMLGGALIEAPKPVSIGDVIYLCDEKLVFHDAPGNTVNYTIE